MRKKPLVEMEVVPGLTVSVSDSLLLQVLEKVIDHAGRGERDKAPVEGERSNDSGNAVVEPNDTRRCAYPAARYGWEDATASSEGRAVCSICCPYNLTCKVKHRTFDDINNPRAGLTPPAGPRTQSSTVPPPESGRNHETEADPRKAP